MTTDLEDDGKSNYQHVNECKVEDCDRCDHLSDFYMSCDTCGHVGHMDADGWYMVDGIPYCNKNCAPEQERRDDE